MAAFKVLIVDDHPVVLTGLTLILSDDPLYTICGQAASPGEACVVAEREQPDIIISDLAMACQERACAARSRKGRRRVPRG